MSLISDDIVDALKEMESDMGDEVVTIDGAAVPCVPTKNVNSRMNSSGGISFSSDHSFYVRKALFETVPTANKAVIYKGKHLRIASDGVSESACGAYLLIDCVHSKQKL